jgi:hypothetical protein
VTTSYMIGLSLVAVGTIHTQTSFWQGFAAVALGSVLVVVCELAMLAKDGRDG